MFGDGNVGLPPGLGTFFRPVMFTGATNVNRGMGGQTREMNALLKHYGGSAARAA